MLKIFSDSFGEIDEKDKRCRTDKRTPDERNTDDEPININTVKAALQRQLCKMSSLT